ncbi:MAG: hypothetical protein OXF66_05050 [Gammaproteobacteria bacterium]|nr:hypothetical protein [Gammaproteobacteria bacterium]MCY4166129.1 hypothetical protein [Gammaproteobacteria bacterium]MCY4255138.1 hypothetical protein [Gammaproteobacteria bacterium]MCY4340110.1 hypothetical protein [Gammaproteobacteria bacterium]
MAIRAVYGLAILAAVIVGLSEQTLGGFLPLAMVVLGAAYAVMNIEAANPQAFLTTALVVWAAGKSDVLKNLDVLVNVGTYLDGIVDQVAVVYLAGGIAILGGRAWKLVTKGSL